MGMTRKTGRGGVQDDPDPYHRGHDEQPDVDEVLAAVGDRPLRDPLHLLELPGGHETAGERQEAQNDLRDDRRHPERGQVRRAFGVPEEVLGGTDQPCGGSTERVGQRRPLRHRGERHHGKRHAHDEAADDRQDDPTVMHHHRLDPCGGDGEQHRGDTCEHRAARRLGVVHPVQREDEQRGRDDVGRLYEGGHYL
jgi:hypothetical protein